MRKEEQERQGEEGVEGRKKSGREEGVEEKEGVEGGKKSRREEGRKEEKEYIPY